MWIISVLLLLLNHHHSATDERTTLYTDCVITRLERRRRSVYNIVGVHYGNGVPGADEGSSNGRENGGRGFEERPFPSPPAVWSGGALYKLPQLGPERNPRRSGDLGHLDVPGVVYIYFTEISVGFCRATEDHTAKFLWGSGATDRYGIGACDLEQLAIDHVVHQLCIG